MCPDFPIDDSDLSILSRARCPLTVRLLRQRRGTWAPTEILYISRGLPFHNRKDVSDWDGRDWLGRGVDPDNRQAFENNSVRRPTAES